MEGKCCENDKPTALMHCLNITIHVSNNLGQQKSLCVVTQATFYKPRAAASFFYNVNYFIFPIFERIKLVTILASDDTDFIIDETRLTKSKG